ncbi:MAG TPA: hypothetical protein VEY07_05525 [Thermoplasmata archaeon]|nr:hypothetical protein [Thermoplasmata archaeon]
MTEPPRPTRTIRVAGYLTELFGIFGVLSGVLAASTFYYFQGQSDYPASSTAALTVIAAIGAAVCVVGVVAGWGLLRSRGWAWNWATGSSMAAVASVGALIAFWPVRWGFLVVVAAAYALVISLLLVGRGTFTKGVRLAPTA